MRIEEEGGEFKREKDESQDSPSFPRMFVPFEWLLHVLAILKRGG